MYDLGDVVTLSTALTDSASQPVDSIGVQVVITLPDGTTATISGEDVQHPATGRYGASYTPTTTGLHRFNWTGTAPAFGESGTFMVWPQLTVVSLEDAKRYVNMKNGDSDEELRGTINAATQAIETWVGPLTPTRVTSRVRSHSGGYTARAAYDGVQGYSSALTLPVHPVLSLVSITPLGGEPIDLTQVFVSPGGVVDAAVSMLYTGRYYDVTYIAGRTQVPADLYQAVLELIRHLWATQRGGAARANTPQGQPPVPGAAFAYPYRVEQLMQPYIQIGIG